MSDIIFNIIYKWSRKFRGGVFLLRFIYGLELPKKAVIGNNVKFNHRGLGTVVSGNACVEDDVWIEHHVTLGSKMNGRDSGAPTIKRGAFLGAYSIILGNITIGENSVVGAGTIVLEDVPDNTIVVSKNEIRMLKKM